jgi:dTDP-4-dehydrorhamnose 3,5-epimerase
MKYPHLPGELPSIQGFEEFAFPIFGDLRGHFRTWFSYSVLLQKGGNFIPKQSNISKSEKNVIRGIHFSDVSYEQSKVITCISGSIVDVSVDLRENSRTFGMHSKIYLSAEKGNSAFITHGLGHAFEVLTSEATIVYLLSSEWNPGLEYVINPLDPDLGICWETDRPILSERDASAPTFNRYFSN